MRARGPVARTLGHSTLCLMFLVGNGPRAAGQAGLVQVTDLGLTTHAAAVDAGFAAFVVPEVHQGGADLNGDGDAGDTVLHLRDTVAGATTNLGLAIDGSLQLGGGYLAFAVDEMEQGQVDLNGDGDAFDRVVHLMDLRTGIVNNLGLARTGELRLGEGVLIFEVDELAQTGADLNGDGDGYDAVVHVCSLASGTVTNLGLAAPAGSGYELAEGLLVFAVPEADQGGSDLNGDGDGLDGVAHVCDLGSGGLINLQLAAWDGLPYPGRVALTVSEPDQGGLDLNGDGDAFDGVLHIFDLGSGSASNLGLAVRNSPLRAGSHLAFLVDEGWQGAMDLNGDGDAQDWVMHVHDVPGASTVNLGLAAIYPGGGFWTDGERLAFPVPEFSQAGSDLNGDGDAADLVMHRFDPIRGLVINLGLHSTQAILRGPRLTMGVAEHSQGATDLNGDGDAQDTVLFLHDLVTGSTLNLGLAGSLSAGSEETLLEVSEPASGVDLNGDGDALDPVLHAHQAPPGTAENLGLAGSVLAFDEGLQAFSVRESGQGGADLNGDGDAQDHVLHLSEPSYPFGFESDADSLSVTAGGILSFELDAGAPHAGELYLILGSLSGTAPGIALGGLHLPLNPDDYFLLTLRAPNAPPFTASLGLLDFMGEARATFTLPPSSPPVLIGRMAHHTCVAVDLSFGWSTFAGNPAALCFAP